MKDKLKSIDKKYLMMFGVVGGFFIFVVLLIIVFSLISGGSLSYSKIENRMVKAAKEYYEENKELLPKEDGEEISIDSNVLAANDNMKELTEYTDEDVVCTGKVIIIKKGSNYEYIPSLDCGKDYKTAFFYEKLLGDLTEEGDGLYKMEDVARPGNAVLGQDEDGYDLSKNPLLYGYIYRGDNLKNYVKIDDTLYRVVKIDGNNDIMLVVAKNNARGVFDDRYNADVDQNDGNNNYELSRVKTSLENFYEESDADLQIKTKTVAKSVCVGGRSESESATDGSVECQKVLHNQYISLVPAYDVMNASLDTGCVTTSSKECDNYNFITSGASSWSMTGNTENTNTAYQISNGLSLKRTSLTATYRYAIYLSKYTLLSGGTGTEKDPYTVK